MLIAKTWRKSPVYCIDIEYPKKEEEIKELILYFAKKHPIIIHPEQIRFVLVGKASKAHETAHKTFKNRNIQDTITASRMIQFLFPQKRTELK